MYGDTGKRVTGRHATPDPLGAAVAGDARSLAAAARAAGDLPSVLALVDRIVGLPGVRTATLGPVPSADDDPFAALAAGVAAVPGVVAEPGVAGPAESVQPVGPPEWRIELRVGFSDPEAYARLTPAVAAVAAAAGRVLHGAFRPATPCAVPAEPARYAAVGRLSRQFAVVVDPVAGWYPLMGGFDAALGYDPEALAGCHLLDLVHPDDWPAAVAALVAACAGPAAHAMGAAYPVGAAHAATYPGGAARPVGAGYDLRVRTVAGDCRTFEVVTATLAAGTAAGTPVVAYLGSDVTALREAQLAVREQQGRLARLVETLPDGVLLIGTDGDLTLVNGAARSLLHLDRWRGGAVRDWDGLLETLRDLLVTAPHPAGVPHAGVLERLTALVAGDEAVAGEALEFSDGRILELDLVPVRCDGRRVGTIVHVRDVTTLVAARRRPAPGESARALAEANRLHHEFVAAVAHELRTPLSSVVAFSCLLGDAATGELTHDQRGCLEIIDRDANRLLRLIDDLLLLTRLESRTLRLELAPVRLRDLLGAAVAEREPPAAEAGVELRVDTVAGPDVEGDEARLHQTLSNLLDNALRYTHRGGQVTVRARPGLGHWTVEVVDTGIGIPATDLPKLFTAFFRGSNVTAGMGRNALPGTGLGLVVCRAIVELHGGGIQVASTEGIGTTVTLTLPAVPERTSEVDRESAAGR